MVSTRPQVAITLAFIAATAAVVSACGPAPQPASTASATTAAAAHADTPTPADGKCDFVNYYHDESKNSQGAGKCATDCDCDGTRSCKSGACTGKARPDVLNAQTCNSKDYLFREEWSPSGPGKCTGDCECDGLRTCASGQCTGTAR